MKKDLCYHTTTKVVCSWKDANSNWGTKENDSNPLKVVTIDLTQAEIDILDTSAATLADDETSGVICVDNAINPTSIIKSV